MSSSNVGGQFHRCANSGLPTCCDTSSGPDYSCRAAATGGGDDVMLSPCGNNFDGSSEDCMKAVGKYGPRWFDDFAFGQQMHTIPVQGRTYAPTTVQVSANRQNKDNNIWETNSAWKGTGGPFIAEYLKLGLCTATLTQN